MKLTDDQIGAIEALITLRERGVSNTEIGRRLEIGFGQQKVSAVFAVFAAMGIGVPRPDCFRGRKPGSRNGVRQARVKGHSAPKGPRVFLSAEEWQHRLAQSGF